MGNGDRPATRAELDAAVARLEGTIGRLRSDMATKAELQSAIERLEGRLTGDMQAMERRLLLEIGNALNIAVEQIGSKIGVVDEKYRPVARQIVTLGADLADHKIDFVLHKRPPSRRTGTRKTPARRAK